MVECQYDAFGRRITQQTIQGGHTTTTDYYYDGEDIILQVKDDGTTSTTTQYVHGPGIDEPLAMIQDGTRYFYHADGLGSIVALTDSNKQIVQRDSYDTFGMLTSVQNPEFNNSYTYTAREWDRELGLYYYRARYYDPMEGRFISKDPIAIGGNIYTQGVNASFFQYVSAVTTPYLYTENNPVNWIDPSGLIKWGLGGVVGPISVSWYSDQPTKTTVEAVTNLELGGGLMICFDNPFKDDCDPPPKLPFTINTGGKWAGISTDNKTICIKLGPAKGLWPGSLSWELGSF